MSAVKEMQQPLGGMTVHESDLALFGGPAAVSCRPRRHWPDITAHDRAAVLAALDSGRLSGTSAPEVRRLEQDYAAYVGVKHCLALNSGTAALHCCAVAADLGPGDEVIVPALTFMASAMAMMHQGAKPILCDVRPDDFNIAAAEIPALVTERTKAIVIVHLHGMPADIDALLAVAAKYGLAVIEDTAQAHGATYHGKKVGTFGLCAGTSLQETKNLPGGDGGLFITDDDGAYLAASRLRIFGEDVYEPKFGRYYCSYGVGWNYRNHELSAALARSQLQRLDAYNAAASENAARLTEYLTGIAGLRLPGSRPDCERVWYAYRVVLEPSEVGFLGSTVELRDRVMRALDAEGVPVMVWQDFPLSAHPVFRRVQSPWRVSDGIGSGLAEWDRTAFPVATHLCEASFLIGEPQTPLAIQEQAVLEQYAAGIRKVMANLDAVLHVPYEPIDRSPQTVQLAQV